MVSQTDPQNSGLGTDSKQQRSVSYHNENRYVGDKSTTEDWRSMHKFQPYFSSTYSMKVKGINPLTPPDLLQSEIPQVHHQPCTSLPKKSILTPLLRPKPPRIQSFSLANPPSPSCKAPTGNSASWSSSAPAQSTTQPPQKNTPNGYSTNAKNTPKISSLSCVPTSRNPAQPLAGRA